MLTLRIIPCLDTREGRVVKGIKFQNLRDAGDPAELAARYAAEGADELVLLDVSATPAGKAHALETVAAVRAVLDIPLTVGGGVRGVEDAGALLDAGADKVAINTAAVFDPSLLTRIATRFGRQCTVLAIDAARRVQTHENTEESPLLRDPLRLAEPEQREITRSFRALGEAIEEGASPSSRFILQGPGSFEVVVKGGRERTGKDAVAWAGEAEACGAGEVLLTSFDQDGTRAGYDLPLIRAIRARVHIPIIASGGAAHADHLAEALAAGADAVLAASIFHDGETTVGALKADLASRGLAVRW